MKKLLSLFTVIMFTFTSCSTDDGGMGPQGPPGPPGEGELGWTFEETVNFNYFPDENMFRTLIEIPENIVTVNPDADAVLVYRLEVAEGLDTWSLIPQNFFLEEGTIQYVYNHSAFDVQIIIDGNFDLSTLSTGFTDGQTFRVVVMPSDTAAVFGVDITNYQAVMSALGIQENEVLHSLD